MFILDDWSLKREFDIIHKWFSVCAEVTVTVIISECFFGVVYPLLFLLGLYLLGIVDDLEVGFSQSK